MKKIVIISLLILIGLPAVYFLPELLSDKKQLSIVAAGDIMLGRGIKRSLANKDHIYPYIRTKSITASADIAFANLECPVSHRGVAEIKKYCFCADTQVIKGLKYAGFDVLSLANNHMLDYGRIALLDTIDILKKNGIAAVGAGRNAEMARQPAIRDINGTKTAFLAYNCTLPVSYYASKKTSGISSGEIKNIFSDIAGIRKEVDLIVVSFHWGKEYEELPTKKQVTLAHQTINAGADLIIGHHPHVLQGIELYRNKLIAYSLGNFVFDQRHGETRKGMLLNITYENKEISRVACLPFVRKYDKYYPRPAIGKERDALIATIKRISKPLNKNQKHLDLLHFE